MPGRIHIGNAENFQTSTRGWFVGAFLDDHHGPLKTDDLQLKWGHHPPGEQRHELAEPAAMASITILISGTFRLDFPGQDPGSVVLREQGDFAYFGPGVPHTWQAEDQSVILTVRWRPTVPAGVT
ncbi:signal peptidase I [Streptomyces sp. NPDC048200]|uniref:signal peptidase I n=1 Tax=Streptomyces sp. NPDC048200 TaxID=3365512 RepID=UPI0037217F9F